MIQTDCATGFEFSTKRLDRVTVLNETNKISNHNDCFFSYNRV